MRQLQMNTLIAVAAISALLLVGCSKTETPASADDNATAAGQNTTANPAPTAAAKPDAAPADIKNGFPTKPPVGTKALCPVMKNEFTVSESTQFSEYNGKFYAFCCPGCKPQFDADPGKFL